MKQLLMTLLLGAGALMFGPAQAHGNYEPDHPGGIVQIVGDLSFELVPVPGGVELYVEEDNEDLPIEGMSAKLTVIAGGVKTETVMTPAGGNKFVAKGLKIPAGAKVAVLLTRKDKVSKVGANFAPK
ncbi:MAG: hypothetical protein NT159_11490 [Proteobacteria bacterium]|nr:hypothetical protein [Pseudomonadota bacterium]